MRGAMDVPSVKKVWRRMTGVAAAFPQVAMVSELQAAKHSLNTTYIQKLSQSTLTNVRNSVRKTIHNKQCAHKHQRRGPRYRSNSQASSAADDEEEEIRFRAEAVGDGGAEEGTTHYSD